eukprot:GHUV01000973.1.p1 GENE.GHUV01000973.1~~GHUV01000973.1.p1  ORF type:complete len:146 (-),score=31.55 GHUV01000973.1:522-959(-)
MNVHFTAHAAAGTQNAGPWHHPKQDRYCCCCIAVAADTCLMEQHPSKDIQLLTSNQNQACWWFAVAAARNHKPGVYCCSTTQQEVRYYCTTSHWPCALPQPHYRSLLYFSAVKTLNWSLQTEPAGVPRWSLLTPHWLLWLPAERL